jgi:hypothetical protein
MSQVQRAAISQEWAKGWSSNRTVKGKNILLRVSLQLLDPWADQADQVGQVD